MTRPVFIAGNWKMNLDRAGAVALAGAVRQGADARACDVTVAVCPVAVQIPAVVEALSGSTVGVGAQNCHGEASGAFTGEIAPAMLRDAGVRYVILGHSERRQLFGETDEVINKKVKAALAAGLEPIVCVGETLAEREAGRTEAVVDAQVTGSLAGLTGEQLQQVTIAYEPVWAIGTGKTATPAQAQDVHAFLRGRLAELFGAVLARDVVIQYGGSVKPDNAEDLLSQEDIDGALVGGASLKIDQFLPIIEAGAARARRRSPVS